MGKKNLHTTCPVCHKKNRFKEDNCRKCGEDLVKNPRGHKDKGGEKKKKRKRKKKVQV